MTDKVTILISFINGRTEEAHIQEGGWWRYTEPHQGPMRLIIKGNPRKNQRHEIPLSSIVSIMVTVHEVQA